MAGFVSSARYLNNDTEKHRRIDMREIDNIDMDPEYMPTDLTLLWIFFKGIDDLELNVNAE